MLQYNISPIYFSQSYYNVPGKIRQNFSRLILYPPATKRYYELIGKENRVRPEVFDTINSHEFSLLDKNSMRVKKNLDELIYGELLCEREDYDKELSNSQRYTTAMYLKPLEGVVV